jgi:hypothetical protein
LTHITDQDGCYLEEELVEEKLILYIRTTRQCTTPCAVKTATTPYIEDDVHNNKTTAPLATLIIFLLLGILIKACIRYFWRSSSGSSLWAEHSVALLLVPPSVTGDSGFNTIPN